MDAGFLINDIMSAMLKWNSIPGNVMDLVFHGPIVPVINEAIVKEYREVLSRSKFHLTAEIVDNVIECVESKGIYVDAEPQNIDLPDPKDRVFYEVVMGERKDEDAFLVTGNLKHFPEKPFIVSPREMIDIILSDMSQ